MSFISVDIESDGPIPGEYSMVCFGAVIVEPTLSNTFYEQTKPITTQYNADALSISGFTREEHLRFDDPTEVMQNFKNWITENSKGRPILISDNNGFDAMFIAYYFHRFLGHNPFGWSSRRLSDLYCGMQNDAYATWKHLRKTKHTHNPVDDARGNAEVLLQMKEMGLKIGLR